MMPRARCSHIVLLIGVMISSLPGATAGQTTRRLWVLQPPNRIVEYDPTTYAPRRSVTVPSDALEHPEWLSISRGGRILFDPDPSRFEYSEPARPETRIWFWDGEVGNHLDRGWTRTETSAGEDVSVVEIAPRCLLPEEGPELFWLGNEFRTLKARDRGIEFSVVASFRAWREGPADEAREQIAEMSFSPCDCGTGFCEETCPRAEVWTPPEGILDYFLVTVWIPGQLGSTYLSTHLFQRSDGGWSAQELPGVMERVLDGARGGHFVVHARMDGACCGWDNESNDLTLLTTDEMSHVLFDERARYANSNYDVSFFTSNAKISPDTRLIALTIVATASRDADIRLVSQGTADAAELDRIRQGLAELPAVEVVRAGEAPGQVAWIPQATLVGWLDENEILVLQDRTLVAVDIASGSRRPSAIRVPGDSHVFLR